VRKPVKKRKRNGLEILNASKGHGMFLFSHICAFRILIHVNREKRREAISEGTMVIPEEKKIRNNEYLRKWREERKA
jgi:hypothetical protein